jgi:hypothetical protein
MLLILEWVVGFNEFPRQAKFFGQLGCQGFYPMHLGRVMAAAN